MHRAVYQRHLSFYIFSIVFITGLTAVGVANVAKPTVTVSNCL